MYTEYKLENVIELAEKVTHNIIVGEFDFKTNRELTRALLYVYRNWTPYGSMYLYALQGVAIQIIKTIRIFQRKDKYKLLWVACDNVRENWTMSIEK